ncbi:MAG: hypothetical protein C0613_13220 [Desulfobulbaceae bacterium]|nr:MAG: hypothetical protein C0613_13220 [Desulfobulbaceae bacterium]
MGNNKADALRALFDFSAPAHAGAAIALFCFFVLIGRHAEMQPEAGNRLSGSFMRSSLHDYIPVQTSTSPYSLLFDAQKGPLSFNNAWLWNI